MVLMSALVLVSACAPKPAATVKPPRPIYISINRDGAIKVSDKAPTPLDDLRAGIQAHRKPGNAQ